MIGAVADVLRDMPGAVLGVLPGGRGNDLARVLEIPRDPVRACETIAQGFTRAMDIGEVMGAHTGAEVSDTQAGERGRTFVGIASVGFDSDANRIANQAPSRLGNLVYAYGALRALISWRPARFEIELSGSSERPTDGPRSKYSTSDYSTGEYSKREYSTSERHTLTGYTVGVANSQAYGGGMRAAPDALLDDGLFDVVTLEHVSKLAFLTRLLPRVFSGAHIHEPSVHVMRAREVTIRADRPFTMYADGDPIAQLPVRVRVLPAAVRVLVPDTAHAAFGGPPTLAGAVEAGESGAGVSKAGASTNVVFAKAVIPTEPADAATTAKMPDRPRGS